MVAATPSAPLSVTRLVASRAVDAELAALLWLLVEGGVPLLVCGDGEAEPLKPALDALLDLRDGAAPADGAPAAESTLGPGRRGTARRPGTTLRAGSLREAFETLTAEPFNFTDDDLRALGLVIVLRDAAVAAAHYVRPVERDGQGHLQRRPPAVLATRDADAPGFEHFAWAMTPELAARIDMTQAAFEREQAHRAAFLSQLVQRGVAEASAVRSAVADYRASHPLDRQSPEPAGPRRRAPLPVLYTRSDPA